MQLAAIAIAVLVIGCTPHAQPLLNDADLLEHFRTHQSDLESLVSMLEEDKQIDAIYSDGSFDAGAISKGRASAYRALRQRTGLTDCMIFSRRYQDQFAVRISIGYIEVGTATWVKGFLYSTEPPSPRRRTLDDLAFREPAPNGRWYRQIEGDWYLFMEGLAGGD